MATSCHSTAVETSAQVANGALISRKLAIIGLGNSGKSVFFNALTDCYSLVANYPHTTVEPNRKTITLNGLSLEIIDTPGISALAMHSEDERATCDILLGEDIDHILFCGDALRLKQSLILLAQVLELGIPTLFCLNKSDAAARRGIVIDTAKLATMLGVTVVTTAAVHGRGLEGLVARTLQAHSNTAPVRYLHDIETALTQFGSLFSVEKRPARGALLQFLQGDTTVDAQYSQQLGQEVLARAYRLRQEFLTAIPLFRLCQSVFNARHAWAQHLLTHTLKRAEMVVPGFSYWAGWSSRHPIFGWPILFAILWLTFQSVGIVAARLADFLNKFLFDPLVGIIGSVFPNPFLHEMLVGSFGLLTMGVINALVTVVPILVVFFLIIHFLEDVGYLPNLGVLATRALSPFGLTGKAVLPIVLATGCNTMATLTSRMLETRTERIAVSFLIALGVPCAVQLGVMLAILAAAPFSALLIVTGAVLATSVGCGMLLKRWMPASAPAAFILELPAFRWPSWRNIALKTYYRIKWFLLEALPLFVFAAALMFTLEKTGLLETIKHVLHPVITGFLDLPDRVTEVFILVLSRREVGAVYFKDMVDQGALDYYQVITGLVVMSLFIPCVSNTMVMIKELGARWAVTMNLAIIAIAILIGGAVNFLIRLV